MAAEPPHPPPRNLLFCGLPPALPRVVLLPCQPRTDDADVADDAEPAIGLDDINNVGVPTCEERLESCEQKNLDQPVTPPNTYGIRRTHSFDSADIYESARLVDTNVRNVHSEPDLTKYGLYLEAEVTVDCGLNNQPPPLVLNNPFYQGSFTLDTDQTSQTMVVLPDNYLAFEDSFVPTWSYGLVVPAQAGELSDNYYYDNVPFLPSTDAWSAYGVDNASFEYSPSFCSPVGDIQYMPLSDMNYAIPEYMSLPAMEQAITETVSSHGDSSTDLHSVVEMSTGTTSNSNDIVDQIPENTVPSPCDVDTENNYIADDEKGVSSRQSTSHSEDSLNADISNDVTSSLAFVPNSFNSQRPETSGDNTSDGTSPCSTDYHEASALDLVHSLDDLSFCDSTDFSQSRDDSSPFFAPDNKNMQSNASENVAIENNQQEQLLVPSKAIENNRGNQRTNDNKPQFPTTLPTAPNNILDLTINKGLPMIDDNEKIATLEKTGPTELAEQMEQPANTTISNTVSSTENVLALEPPIIACAPPIIIDPQPPIRPPEVPAAWLINQSAKKSPLHEIIIPVPQISIENVETAPPEDSQIPSTSNNENAQPSCSFAGTQTSTTTQLIPKEVEVSYQFKFILVLGSNIVKCV